MKPKVRDRLNIPREELHSLTEFEFVELIMETVEKAYRVEDVTARRRTRRISEARQMAMFLAYRMTDCSFPAIGEMFGRDHTTVLHADRRVVERMTTTPQVKLVIQRLAATVNREAMARSETDETED